ncbi:glyoxalase [Agrobacterium sp. ICMP 6402]|uniref:VOC family protein n=1 Tax=Agrobacterium sp. ICMP 6402 TaxID=2292443 RepID=UPI001294C129|nr:VOC family protein [Agrobacterium sp. ICMP 6402]MQB13452.1 glyoxalase [Agrobacterium sp. ICMP 6402]
MTVRRIVTNIATPDLERAGVFYGDILGMTIAMDHDWIVTYASPVETPAQISFAREGGSGTAVPDISIEVDNFDEVHARILKAELSVEYGPAIETWGVRRLFLRDPFGRLVNILSHL